MLLASILITKKGHRLNMLKLSSEIIRWYQDMSRYVKIYQDMSRYVKICQIYVSHTSHPCRMYLRQVDLCGRGLTDCQRKALAGVRAHSTDSHEQALTQASWSPRDACHPVSLIDLNTLIAYIPLFATMQSISSSLRIWKIQQFLLPYCNWIVAVASSGQCL